MKDELKEEGREGEMMGDNDGVLNASEVILDDLSNNDEMSGSNIGFGEL